MKIVIGTPNFNSIMDADVAVNMARCIRAWSKKHEIHWLVVKRTFVCKARSMIVNEAHKLGADYLFWIDDDAIVDVGMLDRLLAHDKDIVMSPYPMRRAPYHCGVLRSTTGDFNDQGSYVNLDWEADMNKGLVEVDGGGTHCMLVKMNIFGPQAYDNETLEDFSKREPGKVPYPWFVLAPSGGTEDMYFCLLARRVGIKIYCDTDVESGHIGFPEIVTSGNGKAWTRKFGKQTLAEVSSKLREGLRYIDVNPAVSYEEMLITPNTLAASVDAVAGQGQGASASLKSVGV